MVRRQFIGMAALAFAAAALPAQAKKAYASSARAMDAAAFLGERFTRSTPPAREWFWAAAKTIVGAVLVGMVRLRRVALRDRARALELLRAPALGWVRGLRRRRRHAQAQHHPAAPSIRSTSTCGSRRVTVAPPLRLTSSIARGSDSGRSMPSRISASSTPPSRPPYVV